jgi:hypothetical protein
LNRLTGWLDGADRPVGLNWLTSWHVVAVDRAMGFNRFF